LDAPLGFAEPDSFNLLLGVEAAGLGSESAKASTALALGATFSFFSCNRLLVRRGAEAAEVTDDGEGSSGTSAPTLGRVWNVEWPNGSIAKAPKLDFKSAGSG